MHVWRYATSSAFCEKIIAKKGEKNQLQRMSRFVWLVIKAEKDMKGEERGCSQDKEVHYHKMKYQVSKW